MKQILQSLRNGMTEVAEIPAPGPRPGHLLIETSHTLVSAGTERMLVEFGKSGLLSKARQQPDRVRDVLNKMRTDGVVPTLEAVFNKLDEPLPLGYCNVGRVLAGDLAGGLSAKPGDRVVSNGKHAGIVSVPSNLCALVPDVVSDDEASFAVLAAIALQGIRLIGPTLGETVVVSGLGLIGLVAVQLLRAHGCRVLGLDFDAGRLALARQFGAETVDLSVGEDPLAVAQAFSRGRGVDAVLITASTKSSEPVHQAAVMCRKRGRIVLVGVTGLELSRADFYEKELTFQVSCSYGPGRYDSSYEDKGNDYPIGFVRWTEQRNFEAVLDMMASGNVDVKPLISHRFEIGDAEAAYAIVAGGEPSLGIVLSYPASAVAAARTVRLAKAVSSDHSGAATVSFIGAGKYSTAVLIPAFKAAGADLRSIASNVGVTGVHAGRKFGFSETTTDTAALLADPQTRAVVVSTRHDSHARYVVGAINAGKHVFVEKPICLTDAELDNIVAAHDAGRSMVMVGFNRRFAPQVRKIKNLLAGTSGPKTFVMTVNAGAIPSEHWTQDPAIGGGRILGEACHFIDLLRFLAGNAITSWQRVDMDSNSGDTATLTLRFADGSMGTIHYFANGNKAFPKERLEVFAAGRVLQLDNFRDLTGFGWPNFRRMRLWRQDKGQRACAEAFIGALKQGGLPPIPFEEIVEVSRVTNALAQEAGR
ncbi:MAG: bi-domain-containing oxidoreductase [Kaiparowitsia implicata GSE-PSE-MK54-09C]|jgi:predicted dehydrogenase/threonine dehydrogenase-like Zn-dependent dehydrogenase|nr:bi-domain-containing oxidoreductase [Kaiparowitsia implicata GSE-PSE-MK54-09C]